MSRSFKHSPYCKDDRRHARSSCKWSKIHYNRKLRRIQGEIPDGNWYRKNVGTYPWDDFRGKTRLPKHVWLKQQDICYRTIMNGTHWAVTVWYSGWKKLYINDSPIAVVLAYMEGDWELYQKRFVRK